MKTWICRLFVGFGLLFYLLGFYYPNLSAQNKEPAQEYLVQQSFTVRNEGPGNALDIGIWAVLIQTLSPYQKVLSRDVNLPDYSIQIDTNNNKYLHFNLDNLPAGKERTIVIEYKVMVHKVAIDLKLCRWAGSIPESVKPFLKLEGIGGSDKSAIKALADRLANGKNSPCEILRAIYEWIGRNIGYDEHLNEDKSALWALQNKRGDCSEFSSLFAALSRAAGSPARIVEGLAYRPGLGDSTGFFHAWVEVWLADLGWVPIDPTWGRFPETKDDYFAKLTPDHIVLTRGNSANLPEQSSFIQYEWSREREVSLSLKDLSLNVVAK